MWELGETHNFNPITYTLVLFKRGKRDRHKIAGIFIFYFLFVRVSLYTARVGWSNSVWLSTRKQETSHEGFPTHDFMCVLYFFSPSAAIVWWFLASIFLHTKTTTKVCVHWALMVPECTQDSTLSRWTFPLSIDKIKLLFSTSFPRIECVF